MRLFKEFSIMSGALSFIVIVTFFIVSSGCRRVEPTKAPLNIPAAKKAAESTQYIVEVGRDGQILSSKEVTDAKPEKVIPPKVETTSINIKEDVRKIMELRDKAEAANTLSLRLFFILLTSKSPL